MRRIAILDPLRGLAALAVMWYHFVYLFKYAERGTFLDWTGKHGDLGVQVFFVISGFILPHAMNAKGYELSNYRIFVLKRVTRLDPPYIMTIFFVLTASIVSNLLHQLAPLSGFDWQRIVSHLAYLNGLFEIKWLVPVFWTLAVEFQFYLLIGLLFPLLVHENKWVIYGVLFTLFSVSFFFPHTGKMGTRPYVFQHMFLFGLGISLFLFKQNRISRNDFISMILLASSGIYFLMGKWECLAGLLTLLSILSFPNWNGGKVLCYFGTISYSLYLIHWTVGKIVINYVDSIPWVPKLIGVLMAVGCCILVADLFNRVIEKPSQKLAARISYRR